MGPVYRITLRQLSGRWRLLIMTVLAALPVLIIVLMLYSSNAPRVAEFEAFVLSTLLAGSIAPLVVLAIASAAFGNEVEDRTLANLTLSPVPRWQIVVPKLLASMTIAAPFILASAFVTSYVAFLGDARAVAAVTLGSLAGVALYASVFVWLGLVSTQAIGIGLLYIVLWEGFVAAFVSGVKLLSIRHYSIALMHAMDARRFAETDHLPAAAAALTTLIVFTGFILLSVRRLRRMDVP
ncbi:MAG TPA: ABC transporter permease subunit [Longimicrobiales bacterium]|nr:ABC transporter permease subunit [Longimicrobiales bacterium]